MSIAGLKRMTTGSVAKLLNLSPPVLYLAIWHIKFIVLLFQRGMCYLWLMLAR